MGKATQKVHCRVGSLEIDSDTPDGQLLVHCRVGSLEMV